MGVMTEEYPQDVPSPAPTRSLQEQFQEADFYIRLGFREEAHAKLDEIAKISPEDPELLARYRQLDTLDSSEEGEQKISAKPVGDNVEETPGEAQPHEQVVFRDLKIDETLDAFDQRDAGENAAEQLTKSALLTDVDLESDTIGIEIPEQPQLQDLPPPEPKESEARVNEMFADLMEEFSSQSDQQTAQEAFDEHFHLGTAYREMDLMEEAIREFQNALKALDQTSTKDTNRVVQCCGMLSTCFLKKGMPSSAVRYCQTGLSVADISSHEAMALRYDMGVAHSMAGSSKMALKCFDQIFAMDPGYRDVAQRIDELRACG
jgi:tetratricopeptide (TPR) repeat protein